MKTIDQQLQSCYRTCLSKIAIPIFGAKKAEECRYACKQSNGFASSKKQLDAWLTAKRNGQLNPDGSPKIEMPVDTEVPTAQQLADNPPKEEQGGLGTGAIIGITLGGLAVIGLITFLILRKK